MIEVKLRRRGDDSMAFFDYNHDGKKDWKDDAREYYLYNKMQEDEEKPKQSKKESPPEAKSDVGCGMILLCFLFLFIAIQIAIWVNSL